MSINKTDAKIISKAFSLPIGDETVNHVNLLECLVMWLISIPVIKV